MRELTLANVKAGDKLFVQRDRYDKGSIITVDRVTPTGRVVTKMGQFDPDGWLRGDSKSWNRTTARIATEDNIAGVNRWNLVRKISEFKGWEKLSPDDLKAVAEIVRRHEVQ